ncbi:hypothetical protein ACZ91_48820 [Streptomyces regensis]|nr:hypothetical protein ACZ91_48820 [Streptomyces regensis]
MERQSVHGDGLELRELGRAAPGELDRGVPVTGLPGACQHAQRVGAQAAAQLTGRHALLGGQVQERLRGGGEISSRVQAHADHVQVHADERVGQVVDRDARGTQAEPQRGDAVVEVGQHLAVGLCGVGVLVALPYLPALGDPALRPAAPHERRSTRIPSGPSRFCGQVRRVQRMKSAPVVGRGGEHVLHMRGSWLVFAEHARLPEDLLNLLSPLLVGSWGNAPLEMGSSLCTDGFISSSPLYADHAEGAWRMSASP